MSKIKQVLLMHRNGMSNRAIAKTIGLDKCTVNEYIRKIKADPWSLDALLRLEEPELEAHMFAGNPAYTDAYVHTAMTLWHSDWLLRYDDQ